MKMRECKKRKEITDALCRLYLNDQSQFIWQFNQYERTIVHCKLKDIDLLSNSVAITPKNKMMSFDGLSSKLPLYFKCSEKEMVFKIEPGDFSVTDERITMKIPGSVRLLENRSEKRFAIDPEKHVNMEVYFPVGGSSPHLTVPIMNLSRGGAALVVSYQNLKFFEIGTKFIMTEIGTRPMAQRVYGTIVYAKKLSKVVAGKVINYVQVGACFETPLQESFILNYV